MSDTLPTAAIRETQRLAEIQRQIEAGVGKFRVAVDSIVEVAARDPGRLRLEFGVVVAGIDVRVVVEVGQ